jgi:hypothetical protein
MLRATLKVKCLLGGPCQLCQAPMRSAGQPLLEVNVSNTLAAHQDKARSRRQAPSAEDANLEHVLGTNMARNQKDHGALPSASI